MVSKSKTVLLAELKNELPEEIMEKINELIKDQVSKVPERFRKEFEDFCVHGPVSVNLSLEFLAGWEINAELKTAMSVVLNRFADEFEKLVPHLRALAE